MAIVSLLVGTLLTMTFFVASGPLLWVTSTLAIIGSGVQAKSHLEAIRHVRALTDVRVWSPTAAHREAFAAEAACTASWLSGGVGAGRWSRNPTSRITRSSIQPKPTSAAGGRRQVGLGLK